MWIAFLIAITSVGLLAANQRIPFGWVVIALAAVMLFRIMMPVADLPPE